MLLRTTNRYFSIINTIVHTHTMANFIKKIYIYILLHIVQHLMIKNIGSCFALEHIQTYINETNMNNYHFFKQAGQTFYGHVKILTSILL